MANCDSGSNGPCASFAAIWPRLHVPSISYYCAAKIEQKNDGTWNGYTIVYIIVFFSFFGNKFTKAIVSGDVDSPTVLFLINRPPTFFSIDFYVSRSFRYH